MRKKLIEEMLPAAMKEADALRNDAGLIPSEYKGYVASLGSSILMMGFKPSMILFLAEKKKEEGKRDPIAKAVTHIVREQAHIQLNEPARQALNALNANSALTDYRLFYTEHGDDRMREAVLHAAVALKLMLNTYSFTEGSAS